MKAKWASVGVLSIGLAAMGCGSDSAGANAGVGEDDTSDDTNDVAEETEVEIFSWWVAPGEAEALQALIDLYGDEHPHSSIYNAALDSGETARADLDARLEANEPPDAFQTNAHDIGAFLTNHPDGLVPLDNFFASEDLDDNIFPEVIDNVTVDGHIVALPVNMHRENSLFYNKDIFAANDLEPPTTVAEFLAACETLKAAGVTPVATSYQGWIQRIMFNSLAMGSMGSAFYHDYYTAGMSPDQPEMQAAIDLYATVMEQYINDDAGDEEFGWTQAADAVLAGDAAMFFHGDWAKGYFVQQGWAPGVDFGVVGAPGASELFLYGVDVFAIPTGALNEDGAFDFFATVASPEGQVAFNKIKGSSPVRSDVALNALDPLGQEVLADLEGADIRMLVRNRNEWDTAFNVFATERDAAALYAAFQDAPPQE